MERETGIKPATFSLGNRESVANEPDGVDLCRPDSRSLNAVVSPVGEQSRIGADSREFTQAQT